MQGGRNTVTYCTVEYFLRNTKQFVPIDKVIFTLLQNPSTPFEQYEPILITLDSKQFHCLFNLVVDCVKRGILDRTIASRFINHCWGVSFPGRISQLCSFL